MLTRGSKGNLPTPPVTTITTARSIPTRPRAMSTTARPVVIGRRSKLGLRGARRRAAAPRSGRPVRGRSEQEVADDLRPSLQGNCDVLICGQPERSTSTARPLRVSTPSCRSARCARRARPRCIRHVGDEHASGDLTCHNVDDCGWWQASFDDSARRRGLRRGMRNVGQLASVAVAPQGELADRDADHLEEDGRFLVVGVRDGDAQVELDQEEVEPHPGGDRGEDAGQPVSGGSSLRPALTSAVEIGLRCST